MRKRIEIVEDLKDYCLSCTECPFENEKLVDKIMEYERRLVLDAVTDNVMFITRAAVVVIIVLAIAFRILS